MATELKLVPNPTGFMGGFLEAEARLEESEVPDFWYGMLFS